LHAAYEEFLTDIAKRIPVIKISYDNFHTAEEMAQRIAEEYSKIQNIRHVDWGKSPKHLTPSGWFIAMSLLSLLLQFSIFKCASVFLSLPFAQAKRRQLSPKTRFWLRRPQCNVPLIVYKTNCRTLQHRGLGISRT